MQQPGSVSRRTRSQVESCSLFPPTHTKPLPPSPQPGETLLKQEKTAETHEAADPPRHCGSFQLDLFSPLDSARPSTPALHVDARVSVLIGGPVTLQVGAASLWIKAPSSRLVN